MYGRILIIGTALALTACSAEALTGVDIEQLPELEQGSIVAWNAMTAQQQAETCDLMAKVGREQYQRTFQIGITDPAVDAGLAAYAFTEMLEARC